MALDLDSILAAVPKPAQLALAAIGGYIVLTRTLNYLRFLVNTFVLPGTNLRKYGKPGTWAVITGASDGLGKEFAYQLAAKGFNLVLVSRTQSKLDALAAELTTKHEAKNLEVKVLAMDFLRNDNADYARLTELVSPLDVGILLNNVGASHSIPTPFLITEDDELRNIININCIGTLKATQAVVPTMIARKKPGLVLTMGTMGGWSPTPYLATYSASKAFLQNWNCALAEELRKDKIDAQLVLSYLVTGPMSKVRRASALIPNPKPFVAAALAKVGAGGWQNYPFTYTPYWAHACMVYAGETILGVGNKILIHQNLKMHQDIRARALRKAAREAKKE